MTHRQQHPQKKSPSTPHNIQPKGKSLNADTAFAGLKFLEAKKGGANDGGQYGGIYEGHTGGKSMVKQENVYNKNISEFIGSQIFQALSLGYGANVSLIAPKSISKKLYQEGGIQDNGANIYVKSDFLKNYSNDMYKDMDKYMSPKTKPSRWFRKDGRGLFFGTREWWANTLTNAFKELNYQDFEKIAPASLLIGDFDIHVGNIGVIRNPQNFTDPPRLVRIDFAGSLNNLEDEIHPHSISRHLPFFGPTNHYREFPDFLKNNDLFADSLIKTAEINLAQTIDKIFYELSQYYSDIALAQWAQKALPNKFSKLPVGQIAVEDIKTSFKEVMQKRQNSLEEYGIQIKLSVLDTAEAIDKKKLKQLIRNHRAYFNDIITFKKGKKLKKRFKKAYQLANNLSQILIQMITTLFYMILQEAGKEEEFRRKILHIAKQTLQEPCATIKNTEGNVPLLNTQLKIEVKEEKTILLDKPISIVNSGDLVLGAMVEPICNRRAGSNFVTNFSSIDYNNALPPDAYKIALPQEATAVKPIASEAIKETISPPYLSNIIKDAEPKKTLEQKIIEIKQNLTKFISLHNKSDEDINIVIEEVDKNLEKKNGATKMGLIEGIVQDNSISPQQKITILRAIVARDETRRNALIESMAANPQSINNSSLIAGNVEFKSFIKENIDKLNVQIERDPANNKKPRSNTRSPAPAG